MRPSSRAFLTVAVIAVLGLVTLGGGYAFIRSPAGSRFLIREAQNAARTHGAELTIGEGSVDPFRGAHFRNLKLVREGMKMTIDAVDLDYRLGFFPRAVTVESFSVSHPALKLTALPPPAAEGAPAKPAPDLKKEEADLSHWLESPPALIEVKSFSLDALDADVALADGTRAQVRGASAHGSMQWVASKLVLAGDFDLPDLSNVNWAEDGVKIGLRHAQATAHGEFGVHRDGGSWIYEILPSKMTGELAGLDAHLHETMSIELAAAHLDSHQQVSARTAALFELDPDAIQKLEASAELALGNLRVNQPGRVSAIAAQKGTLRLAMGDDIALAIDYGAERVSLEPAPAPAFRKPVPLSYHAQAKLTRAFDRFESTGEAKLDGHALFASELKAAIDPRGAAVDGQVHILPNAALAADLLPPAARARIGALGAEATLSARAKGAFRTLLAAAEAAREGALELELGARVAQIVAPPAGSKGPSTHFRPIELHATATRIATGVAGSGAESPLDLKWSVDAPEVRVVVPGAEPRPPLKLQADGGGTWKAADKTAEFDGRMSLQGEQALKFHAAIAQPEADHIHSQSSLSFVTGDYLSRAGWLKPEQLKAVGHWAADAELTVDLNGRKLSGAGSAKIEQAREAGAGPGPVVLAQPLVASGKLEMDLDHGHTEGQLDANLPSLEIPRMAKVSDTHLAATVHATSAGHTEFDANLTQGTIALSPALTTHAPVLGGFNAKLSGELGADGAFALTQLDGDFDHEVIHFSASGAGQGKDAQARGRFTLAIPSNFPRVAGALARGRVEFPWSLSLLNGKEIVFEGQAQVTGMSVSYFMRPKGGGPDETFGVLGISGVVPISEKWLWNGRHLRFTDLITRNPFERVDFERVRPLLDSESQFRVEQLAWDERRYGPFIGFFSVKQNMLIAPQFDLDLGKESGHVYGEMFFDAYPADLQFGILSRVTGVNLAELLPRRYLTKMPAGDKTVSGRTGLVVDFNKGTVDGRVDVTEIGSSQLLLMINVLDPNYQDEKMNKIRTALGFGYPNFVELAFSDGYLDMDMNLVALGVSKDFGVRGIPISPMISSATSELVKKTQEGPLE